MNQRRDIFTGDGGPLRKGGGGGREVDGGPLRGGKGGAHFLID